MKKFKNMKGFVCGLLVGSIGITSVFAAGGIKSAVFNSNKVILDGKILDLGGQQMISIVKDGETNASNYMPVRGVLEAMGYTVDWDGNRKAVIVSSGGSNNIGITDPVPVVPTPIPTPQTNTIYYKNFPTVPDFRWAVKNLYSIPNENTLGSGGLDWMEESYPCYDLPDTRHLFDAYVSILLSEGFTLISDNVSAEKSPYRDNIVIKKFQKGSTIVDFSSYYDLMGGVLKLLLHKNKTLGTI